LTRLARIFWLGAAALLVAAALVAIVALLRGELTETDGRILLTLGALFLVGATGLAGLALADRDRYSELGWAVAVLASVEFGILAIWIWSDLPGETRDRLALTAVLAVVGQLAVATQLLLLSKPRLLPLVAATAVAVTAAAGGTVAAIWTEPEDTAWAKVLAVLWILAGLGWFLLPVLQRLMAAGAATEERVVAELDGVELVASRSALEGIAVEAPARGEHLVLRRRGGAGRPG
jgi:hypothetical protein